MIGFPAISFFAMYTGRKKIYTAMKNDFSDPGVNRVTSRYGFLFKGFNSKFYYWECVVMLRKVSLITGVVFMAHHPNLQAWWTTQVLAVFFFLQVKCRPYLAVEILKWDKETQSKSKIETKEYLDDLEEFGLATSFTIFVGGQVLFFAAVQPYEELKVFITISVVLFALAWFTVLFYEVGRLLLQKAVKVMVNSRFFPCVKAESKLVIQMNHLDAKNVTLDIRKDSDELKRKATSYQWRWASRGTKVSPSDSPRPIKVTPVPVPPVGTSEEEEKQDNNTTRSSAAPLT